MPRSEVSPAVRGFVDYHSDGSKSNGSEGQTPKELVVYLALPLGQQVCRCCSLEIENAYILHQ